MTCEPPPSAPEDLDVPAADRIDSQKSEAIDMSHDQTDLVAMRIEQNRRITGRIDDGVDTAMSIRCDVIRKRSRKLAHDLLNPVSAPEVPGSSADQ